MPARRLSSLKRRRVIWLDEDRKVTADTSKGTDDGEVPEKNNSTETFEPTPGQQANLKTPKELF